ncbi:hypothetical protein BGY98DRAFT_987728 [Russula aff. rugulosa BPL654]|nr:hypothetical protein BGY98DRAFT_987728 [Russula aff. rugulosa BPL654]
MQCTWLTKANVITLRTTFALSAGRKNLASKICPSGIWRIRSIRYLHTISSYHVSKPTPRTMELPTLDLPHTRTRLHSSTIDPPSALGHLSSPQISRASAAAIRISVARGDTWDGFHLWHSLRWSIYRHREPGSSPAPQPPFRSPSPFVPIDFGRPVSTRLAAHGLLHSLLRAGKTEIAAKLTERIMADGEELHPLSFGTLLSQLNLASSKSPQAAYDRLRSLTPPRKVQLGPKILDLKNVVPTNPFTRIAVRLLNRARENRWQRTTGIYDSVFRACLMQGEIVVASLLLVLLLKDYQLRHACSRVATIAKEVGVQDTIAYIQSKIPEAPYRGFKNLPHPSSHFLYKRVIEILVKHCTQVEGPLFPEASQALAILASELDVRRIPFAYPTLIKIMYSYPQCEHTVWITLPSGKRQLRNANQYFNEVLLNLLRSFPDQGSRLITSRLPSFSVESYNALLHYALRCRHSVELANRVLRHMTKLRKPPLTPSASTYNILLRSSTLMRRNDIAESVLRIMPRQMPGNKAEVHPFSLDTIQGRNSRMESSSTGSQLGGHRLRLHKKLKGIRKYKLNIPKPKERLKPDKMLITSYMAHLVATGRPDMVAILITRVIPEFELHKEPRWQTSVARGVTLGPHFFAAGHRRLTERTKALESGVTTPWCLSLYADETKVTCTKRTGHPLHPRDPNRAASAMRKGMGVFRALSLAAVKVHDAAVRARKESREWKHPPTPPRVDARFYNAALSLVWRWPGMLPCGSHQGSRSWWNHMLGKMHKRFLLKGQRPHGRIPELEEIGKSLRSSGYAPPIGFGLRLVGWDEQVTSRRTDFRARPYSFGRITRARFAPHRLPTIKTKGLPLRRRWRGSRWSDLRILQKDR